MALRALLILALVAPPPLVQSDRLTYTIATTWDGQAISDHDPATVSLDVNGEGDLLVEASAPFFNSPVPPPELALRDDACPQRPHGSLYNYEARDWRSYVVMQHYSFSFAR